MHASPEAYHHDTAQDYGIVHWTMARVKRLRSSRATLGPGARLLPRRTPRAPAVVIVVIAPVLLAEFRWQSKHEITISQERPVNTPGAARGTSLPGRVEGKVAIVTGGAYGIGRATAGLLALCVASRQPPPHANASVPPLRRLPGTNPQVVGSQDDLAEERQQRANEGDHRGHKEQDNHRGELQSEQGADKERGHREAQTQGTG